MSAITKDLRAAAKSAPMWKTIFEAAADEIERLHGRESEIKAEAVQEFVGQYDYNKDHPEFCIRKLGEQYAEKIKRGEL